MSQHSGIRLSIRRCTATVLTAVSVHLGSSLVFVSDLLAQTERPASGPAIVAPDNVIAAKAFAMLERSCARCHQAGRIEAGAPRAGIANILALDEVSRDPSLVRRGVPDASRIYNVALTGERHHDVLNDPGIAIPTSDEVQALRDWIGELPPLKAGASCAEDVRIDARRVADALSSAIAMLEPETARQTRFVSLAHLHNACIAGPELTRLGQAARAFLASLVKEGPIRDPSWLRSVDAAGSIFAISLSALGWRGQTWDDLAARSPLSGMPALPPAIAESTGTRTPLLQADWLAHALLMREVPAPSPPTTPPTSPLAWGLPPIEALAHAWRRPLGLERLAADLWISPQALKDRLADTALESDLAARQLRSGDTARRSAIMHLLPAPMTRGTAAAAPPETAEPIEIALWADSERYRVGDPAIFSVTASRDCHLTLISVDRAGRATVLFPSEMEPANLLFGGSTIRVPAANAPYKFRFKDKGRETVVAVCSPTHITPAGIAHDYDRLRFTVLGDWQLFLREPPELKEARRDDAATDIPRPLVTQRRRGRGRDQNATSPAAVAGPDLQTRTAIIIDVE